MSRRVALMRPVQDAERSAALLRSRGFEPVLAPAIAIRPTRGGPPDQAFDVLLATSANAFSTLSFEARTVLTRADLMVCVAGERTSAAARAAGFPDAEIIAPDAIALAHAIATRLPAAARLLYLAARDRKGDLEASLAAAGRRVVACEIYAAEARATWSADEALALSTCEAALHYSRRSAELAWILAGRARLADHFRALSHVCISQDAAAPLQTVGATRIAVASAAQESDLVDALEAAVATGRG